MSKLEELIVELCPDGVEYKAISECIQKINNIKWNECPNIEFRYIDLTSVDRDTHRITDTQKITAENAPSRAQQLVKEGDVLLGTTRPMLKRYCLIEEAYDGQICSTGFCVLRAKDTLVLNGWLYHQISSSAFFAHVEKLQKGASYPAISDADVKSYKIPVPPLPVQSEIVRILDDFTELTTHLQEQLAKELTARKKQYEYYRDKLLTFDVLGGGASDCIWRTLAEIATFTYGYTAKAQDKGDARFIRITDIDEDGCLCSSDAKFVALTEESKKYLLKQGDLLLARTGATYGKTLYIPDDQPAVYASFLIKIQLNNSVMLNRYYWHFSKSNYYWKQAEKYVSKGGQQQFNSGAVGRIVIPVPPLPVQERIVSILDRFDALCNDLTSGLPAEIAARQKQYEYYRDKLLTFKEKVC